MTDEKKKDRIIPATCLLVVDLNESITRPFVDLSILVSSSVERGEIKVIRYVCFTLHYYYYFIWPSSSHHHSSTGTFFFFKDVVVSVYV